MMLSKPALGSRIGRLQPCSHVAPSGRQTLRLQCAAGKGFGNAQQKKNPSKEEELPGELSGTKVRRANKSKGKVQRRMPQPPQPQPQPQQPAMQQLAGAQPFDPMSEGGSGMNAVEEVEFEQRLKVLKAESELKKREVAAAKAGQAAPVGGVLDTPRRRQEQEDIYANPPSLGSTLFGGDKDKEKGADSYEGMKLGPGQLGLAVASLALVGVFALTNGSSDLAYMLSPSPGQGEVRKVELTEEVRNELEKQLAEFSTQLAAAPEDLEALEGAAVVNARLGNFKEAAQQLQQLVGARPGDSDAWRVLAEAQGGMGDVKAAVESYRSAWEAVQAAAAPAGSARGSLEILQGLAAELVAAGQEQQAVELVTGARALAAALPEAAADAAAAGGAGGLGPVEVELLLGKVYSQWRGHTAEALAVYEGLVSSRPDDFRGFLAKGLLLSEQGRAADAQRAFIQARYLAPKESRPLVDRIINQRQQK